MNDTLLRHWAMLQHIPRHPKKIDSVTLQNKLEAAGYDTTLRSVQRDLVKLSLALPLISDNAKPQGWSWRADAAQLDLPALDPQAALTFKLVEDYLKKLLPATTCEYLQPWFQTAAGVLDAHGNGLAKWPDKIRVLPKGQPLQPPRIDPAAQAAIYQALLQEKQANVTYLPRGASETKTYVINALALVVRDQVIYLVCTMRDYGDIRHLVLHRIQRCELLDQPSTRLDDFDLDAHILQGEFGLPQGEGRIVLEAEFTKEAAVGIYECPLSDDQTITDLANDNVLIRATVLDTAELRWWLLGFGDQVVVLEPAPLREEFKEIAVNLASFYLD